MSPVVYLVLNKALLFRYLTLFDRRSIWNFLVYLLILLWSLIYLPYLCNECFNFNCLLAISILYLFSFKCFALRLFCDWCVIAWSGFAYCVLYLLWVCFCVFKHVTCLFNVLNFIYFIYLTIFSNAFVCLYDFSSQFYSSSMQFWLSV